MDWPMADEWPLAPQDTCCCSCEEHKKRPAPKPPDPGGPAQAQPYLSQSLPYPIYSQSTMEVPPPSDHVSTLRGETPRDLRNKAEKQRRDKMNKAINELSKIVPPVLAMNRKVDKTSVLRLTAHYLRSHQHGQRVERSGGAKYSGSPIPDDHDQSEKTAATKKNIFLQWAKADDDDDYDGVIQEILVIHYKIFVYMICRKKRCPC
ncbi:Protein cycle [Papilio machaon]|uniref:Protein cycle n=1 Tax=Papilio machaon TaxID=76193 RepID=A0A194QW84_PAPMA|nr:Protein cycle [Papilio machaon]